MEEVIHLRKLGFPWVKISEMLHISRSTLYRRLEGTDLIGFSEITDMELDSVISVYKATHPNDGEVMVIGHLRANEINLPRERIRKSIHRVDPLGVSERRLTTIRCTR